MPIRGYGGVARKLAPFVLTAAISSAVSVWVSSFVLTGPASLDLVIREQRARLEEAQRLSDRIGRLEGVAVGR